MGAPRASRGRERGSATIQDGGPVATCPDAALPSPDPLTGATLPRGGGRACAALACLILLAAPAQAADACDALAAKVIRATGASLAGRAGAYAVFRAQDAERLSLDCRAPTRITVASLDREPPRAYFALVGLAARALTGADPAYAEVLALNLHQDSLLASAPRRGGTGPALMLCETGPRTDALSGDLTVCRIAPAAGLSRHRPAG